jgi:hypothetical protein
MGTRTVGKPKLKRAKRKHFFFKKLPKRVSDWRLSVNDLGLDEVPIHERLIWRAKGERED